MSNVTASVPSGSSSTDTLRQFADPPKSQTRILINGHPPSASGSGAHGHKKTSSSASKRKEIPLLTLYPTSQTLASEWLDGLLMLLNQKHITAETAKLCRTISDWGLKIRLLNVRFEEGFEPEEGQGEVTSREGLDDNYYYDVFGGA